MFYRSYLFRPLAHLMTNLNDFLHGVWIGSKVRIGKGVSFSHPRGLIVNPAVRIGDYLSILQRVTIGGQNVEIGDYVEINAGGQIISNKRGPGKLKIGDNAVIAAGAVVIEDVEGNAVVAGVPAKVVAYHEKGNNWYSFLVEKNG
jgi:serine O-acetyltransferase